MYGCHLPLLWVIITTDTHTHHICNYVLFMVDIHYEPLRHFSWEGSLEPTGHQGRQWKTISGSMAHTVAPQPY